jgi:hypothetical protein
MYSTILQNEGGQNTRQTCGEIKYDFSGSIIRRPASSVTLTVHASVWFLLPSLC